MLPNIIAAFLLAASAPMEEKVLKPLVAVVEEEDAELEDDLLALEEGVEMEASEEIEEVAQ